MAAVTPLVQPCADFNTRSCSNGSWCTFLHGPDSFSVSTGGRNVCLAFLAKLSCAGCNYSHERHDVAISDDELSPIIQQKLHAIQSWFGRTQRSFLPPAPTFTTPAALGPPTSNGYSQPQPRYSPRNQVQIVSSFANTDPSKVIEFKPTGLPTPVSPQKDKSLADAPNEEPENRAASPLESVQHNAEFKTAAPTPDSGTNTENKEAEQEEGSEPKAKFDWAEDADRTLPISPPSWNQGTGGWDNRGWGEPQVASDHMLSTGPITPTKEEPTVEVTQDVVDAWTSQFGEASVGPDNSADPWEAPPKESVRWDIPHSNETWGSKNGNEGNEGNWRVPQKGKHSKYTGKKEKERPSKEPPLAPKPTNRESYKGPAEKDRKNWGTAKGVTTWNINQKEKNGKSPPASAASTASTNPDTDAIFGPTKQKHQNHFTFTRITPSSSSTTTPHSPKERWEDGNLEPDPNELPQLPPDLQQEDLPLEFKNRLRQGLVTKPKMSTQPSVAPLPEGANNDKGMDWVNGTLETGWEVDTPKDCSPKDFSERKVQVGETNGWHPTRVKRSKAKPSSPTAGWRKLGK